MGIELTPEGAHSRAAHPPGFSRLRLCIPATPHRGGARANGGGDGPVEPMSLLLSSTSPTSDAFVAPGALPSGCPPSSRLCRPALTIWPKPPRSPVSRRAHPEGCSPNAEDLVPGTSPHFLAARRSERRLHEPPSRAWGPAPFIVSTRDALSRGSRRLAADVVGNMSPCSPRHRRCSAFTRSRRHRRSFVTPATPRPGSHCPARIPPARSDGYLSHRAALAPAPFTVRHLSVRSEARPARSPWPSLARAPPRRSGLPPSAWLRMRR